MKRREFVRRGAVLGGGILAGAPLAAGAGDTVAAPVVRARRADYDLVLRGGWIVDGTGAPRFRGDLAVAGDRIAAVGRVEGAGALELDVAGLVVSPGFIDIHSHAELSLFINPRAESRIRQGVTLEVVGQDGSSVGPWSPEEADATRARYRRDFGVEIDFSDPGGFLDGVDRLRPAVNVATMVGHGTVRGRVMGLENRPASAGELERMRALVRDALARGAVGLSSGLEYTPGSFGGTDELVALATELRGTGLPYASHMRNEDDRVLAAVEEAIQVGRMAGIPVEIAHLKAQGQRNYWKASSALTMIEEARAAGVEVHFDRYPYVAYSTTLANLFPASARAGGMDAFVGRLQDPDHLPALEAAARAKVELLGDWNAVQISSTRSAGTAWARGRRVGELAAERGEDPFELTRRLLIEDRGGIGMIGFGMSEENTTRLLAHPLGMVCSDGGAFAPYGPLSSGSPHPRGYGTFPRFLGHYVRDVRALPLEEAVRKITSMPAAKLGLAERGILEAGRAADVVAFDPDTVADRATFEDPHQYPEGIPLVVVNGVLTLRDGEHTGDLAGRAVRSSGGSRG
jgi:N-acyl-D-amino-acid deacylase